MNRFLFTCVIIFLIALSCEVFAQSFVVPLTVSDNGSGTTILHFGVATDASYCIDTALGEFELPPKPPNSVFDARFTDQRGTGDCLGQGVACHIQGSAIVDFVDTFQVEFQPGEGGFPFHLSWPSGLSSYFTSLKLVDLFGGILVNVNMLADTVATIPIPFGQLRIVAVGFWTSLSQSGEPFCCSLCPPTSVEDEQKSLRPDGSILLHQNYPNPFNPSTTIEFSIAKPTFATVTIFNILGEHIRTVASQNFLTGTAFLTWDGVDEHGSRVGSGIYIVRIYGESFNAEGRKEYHSTAKQVMLMK